MLSSGNPSDKILEPPLRVIHYAGFNQGENTGEDS
jgi:hypothetical protein